MELYNRALKFHSVKYFSQYIINIIRRKNEKRIISLAHRINTFHRVRRACRARRNTHCYYRAAYPYYSNAQAVGAMREF